MTPEQTEQKLKERFSDAILATRIGLNGLEVRVNPQKLVDICRFLRDDPEMDFNFLRCISAVDWLMMVNLRSFTICSLSATGTSWSSRFVSPVLTLMSLR